MDSRKLMQTNQALGRLYMRSQLESVPDLVYVPELVELLRIPMTEGEGIQVLGMIATRMQPILNLFDNQVCDRITRCTIRDIFIRTWDLFGISMPEAPRVICDETNNPPDVVDDKNVVVDIWFRVMPTVRVC